MKNSSKPCFDEKGGAAQKANIYPRKPTYILKTNYICFFGLLLLSSLFAKFNFANLIDISYPFAVPQAQIRKSGSF